MKNRPLISIIIPTFNSEKTLGECLQSIKNQTYKNIEIIVVDKFSSDKTLEIAREYSKKIFQKGPERTYQRNFGVQKANGDYLLMLDSDMILEKRVVEECVSLKNPETAIIIPEFSQGVGFWSACRALEKKCYLKDSLIEAPRFFSKRIFQQIGGYEEKPFAFEDWVLQQKLKKGKVKFSRIESRIYHQEGKLRLLSCWKKKYYYGKNFKVYLFQHPQAAVAQVNPFRLAFFHHWQMLLKHPFLTSGLFILKSGEFFAGLAGFFASQFNQPRHE